MHRPILLLTAVFFFAFTPPLWSDTLWNKAVRHFSSKATLPVNVTIEETFIGTEGKIEHRSILESTLFRTPDNRILFVPHTGYANGEEIPKAELGQMSEVLAEKDLRKNPFAADAQARLKWRQEKEARTIAGHACRRFSFSGEIDGHRSEGLAWLTEDGGLPLEVEWRFVDVPFKQGETTINAFNQKDSYGISRAGECNILATEISMSLRYTLFFVPYEGRLQRKMTFANHRKRQDLPLNAIAGN